MRRRKLPRAAWRGNRCFRHRSRAPRAAQAYPARTITLVAPIAAGGAVDTAARILAEKLQEQLQGSVVVENRTGAGGMIGTASVAKAPPDGYTLLLMEPSAALAKWLHKNVSFDVIVDFTPIALVATSPLVLFARPSLPANDIKQLIAYSKANPGKLAVGTPGIGSPHHMAVLLLNAAAGIDIPQISYRGSAPALSDLLGGQIPLIWSTADCRDAVRGAGQGEGAGSLDRTTRSDPAAGADHCGECIARISHRCLARRGGARQHIAGSGHAPWRRHSGHYGAVRSRATDVALRIQARLPAPRRNSGSLSRASTNAMVTVIRAAGIVPN